MWANCFEPPENGTVRESFILNSSDTYTHPGYQEIRLLSISHNSGDVRSPLRIHWYRYRSYLGRIRSGWCVIVVDNCGEYPYFLIINHLTFQKVERALRTWETGTFVLNAKDPAQWFSKSNWGTTTKRFVKGIKSIDNDRWTAILEATVHYTQFGPNGNGMAIDVDLDDIDDPRTQAPPSGICPSLKFLHHTNDLIDI